MTLLLGDGLKVTQREDEGKRVWVLLIQHAEVGRFAFIDEQVEKDLFVKIVALRREKRRQGDNFDLSDLIEEVQDNFGPMRSA